MPKKITLNAETFPVPLSKLTLSPKNVRKTYDPAEIEEMAASIAVKGRGLIQNLGVTEQMDEAGMPTGLWEVVAGGRRYRGLALLCERKRLAANAPIPCRRVEDENAIETSLAENEDRRALHPADAYEAFAALRNGGKGLGVEEIAARFNVTAHTVRQRLRLGTVSPALLTAYREGGLTLDHVMAFTITDDHAAQERVFEELPEWQRTPHAIRRVLTQGKVPAHDARVRLIGMEAYQAAGGQVQRDLFTEDGGGWIMDASLLERLVGEHVQEAVDQVRAEGWKWIVTDYSHVRECQHSLRRVWPKRVRLSEADESRRDELAARFDKLALEYPDGDDDTPTAVQTEFRAIQEELDALDARETRYDPEDVARAGVSINLTEGGLRIDRGYVRPEDEPQLEAKPTNEQEEDEIEGEEESNQDSVEETEGEGALAGSISAPPAQPMTPAKVPALSSELEAELSAYRTTALRAEIMRQPDLGLRVLAHSLATATFYDGYRPTVARIAHAYSASYGIGSAVPTDSPARVAIKALEDEQQARMPADHADLWAWLQDLDVPAIHGLLTVCIGRVAEAGGGDWTGTTAKPHVSAQAAQRAGLDMRDWWTATQATYFSRVTKAGILDAVQEAAGDDAARRIVDMKKDAMADNAEALLTDKGWLPARLRVPPGIEAEPVSAPEAGGGEGDGSERRMAAE